ncbi:MAG: DNA/RNA non-specific endonuclease [Bacteroidota bacterium]
MKMKHIAFGLMMAFIVFSCSEEDTLDDINEMIEAETLTIDGEIPNIEVHYYDNEGPHDYEGHNNASGYTMARTTGFTESFESGSKSAYAGGSVSLSSGSWYLSDALIGTSSSDRKYNSKSARIRNTGYAIMSFDMDNGVSTIRVRHAKFGSDSNSSWRLIVSYNGGSSWQYAGGTINTTSTTLNTVSFTINTSARVRFGIYKTGGGSSRINIDNFEINTTASGGGGSGTATRDNNLTFGNPSNASNSPNNYLVSRTDYAASYNNDRGTPNWVSWHLSTAWTGSAPRCNCFKSDTSLPSSFFRPTSGNYTNSGFDRGHICPSADRTYSSTANSNTFFMTNIAPQSPDNNQRSWARLEDYCRKLADDGNELYIVAGIAGTGGTGRNGFRSTISSGRIDVPDSFWKVILILPNGSNDINRVTTSTRVIAVNIPNDMNINTNWGNFRTSVNSIESLTGLDLFENINNSIEFTLESRVDNGPTQ